MVMMKIILLGLCAFFLTSKNSVEACNDKNSNCGIFKSLGYCQNARHSTIMKIYCQRTCGHCCTDLHPVCSSWKMYCFSDRVKNLCKKTCDACNDGPTTMPPLPPVETTKPGPVITHPPVTGSCGQPEVQQSRVIAGDSAKKGAWPWQVLMIFRGKGMCGGSLISPNWVVTAAHCVYGREHYFRYFTMRVGEHTKLTTSDGQHQDIAVEKIITHPSYSQTTINNDIALIKLKTPVTFGKYVKPVCLPNQNQHVPVGTECFITGWGKTQFPGNMHHTLQQGKIPVVSNTACANMNTRNIGVQITDQMVCAGHGGKTRLIGCHGDSGGPFVCQTGANGRWVLHGAVSWGSGRCDASQAYTVFARISKFRSWIDQQMANN